MSRRAMLPLFLSFLLIGFVGSAEAQLVARDPGVRSGPPGAGDALTGLTSNQQAVFRVGQTRFLKVDSVQGTIPGTDVGLGPRFNLDSCAGCHAHPAVGGSSPPVNPQIAVATAEGATNQVPSFVSIDGPVREVRFKFKPDGTRDGGVHALFTITGRSDAPGCTISQPDFEAQRARNNVSLRIPTPTFGLGLVEAIPDGAIVANMDASAGLKRRLGIVGHPNQSGNDGTITRFGWKAQNKSIEIFTGEAYNVEQGVTNELFPNERDSTPGCQFNALPEDSTNFNAVVPSDMLPDTVAFPIFMRLLAPPAPATPTASTLRGAKVFRDIGCALWHTPILTTGASSIAALDTKPVNLYSDLIVHPMGATLADEIVQGAAGPDEFRTAPLWGLGQRLFLLHDGRTSDVRDAIELHASPPTERYGPSSANAVTAAFRALSEPLKQDLLNFLRSL